MIELTRLNGSPIFVNSDLIKWAEAAPDTMLTLIHGEKVVVRESCSEVVARITAHRAVLLSTAIRQAPGMDFASQAVTGAAAAAQSAWKAEPDARNSPERPRPGHPGTD
jgi:flagellar protein FlbD